MAVVLEGLIDMWRGTEPTITATAVVAGGGTENTFYLRFGKLGAKAQLEKEMTESNSTSTSVDLSVSLTVEETSTTIKDAIVDFQILSTNPVDVLLEGKFRMRPILR